MKFYKTLILLFSIALALNVNAGNNDEYISLQSSGEMPDDFTMAIEDRIALNMAKISKVKAAPALKVNYATHNALSTESLLNSGLVLFGDELSKFTESVAKKLLKDETETFEKLRFYTYRSNEINAFVTLDGMVFVTIGLFSQITCEEQLAFILAHEISHYQENHIIKSYENQLVLRTNPNKRLKLLSDFSKGQELEADSLGFELYSASGYRTDKAAGVFDVLLYADLPIDEIHYSNENLNSDLIYLPDYMFDVESKHTTINISSDYEDEYSTHPNIKKRLKKLIDDFDDRLSSVSAMEVDKLHFNKIQKISRLERINNFLYSREFDYCLYEIACLKKLYGNLKFLEEAEVHLWLGFAAFSVKKKKKETYSNYKSVEGSLSRVSYFMAQLSRNQVVILAARVVKDYNLKYPTEEFAKNALYASQLYLVLNKSNEKYFSKDNFHEASRKYTDSITQLRLDFEKGQLDSNKYSIAGDDIIRPANWNEMTKYEKIHWEKNKNFTEAPEINDDSFTDFDTTKFHFYLLSDLDADYLAGLDRIRKEESQKEIINDKRMAYIDSISKGNNKKVEENRGRESLKLGLSKAIVIEPSVHYSGSKLHSGL